MILLIDNYDSFSYNLYQYLGTLTDEIRVIRNDAMTVAEVPTVVLAAPSVPATKTPPPPAPTTSRSPQKKSSSIPG